MTTSQTVAADMVVTLSYAVHSADGEFIDSSDDSGPLEYLHGQGGLVPGLEAALTGMAVGESKEVTLAPEDAYGEWEEDAFEEVPLSMFGDEELYEGMEIYLEDDDGEVTEAWVSEIYENAVLLDFNHPLAGETLVFEVTVEAIRAATAEELEHGHVHGE
ncbi:MAG: peptidylprolyl isomerase [Caldilineales bacterium]|nr:peptidylprolyl isomerase [Caldilineales bacterium]